MEINSFSQRISKIYGNRKFGRFGVVLKLEFEVKNWYIHKNLFVHYTHLCLAPFCKFLGDF